VVVLTHAIIQVRAG